MNVFYRRVDNPNHLTPQKIFNEAVEHDPMMLEFIPAHF